MYLGSKNMTFYIINLGINKNKNIVQAFKEASSKLGTDIKIIVNKNFDVKLIARDDILYRITTDKISKELEKNLVMSRKPKSLYLNVNEVDIDKVEENVIKSTEVHVENNIVMPKTNFENTSVKEKLKKIVDELGGYPVVIKEIGGQKGLGVSKAENINELVNISRRLISTNKKYIIREFVDSPGISYRSIVLGNKILVTYKNESVDKSDFRSNINQKERIRKIVEVSKKDEKQIIKSVRCLKVSFGAVDFAYDSKDNNKMKIFEVNFPCNFVPAQRLSGIDIAKKILAYLIKK